MDVEGVFGHASSHLGGGLERSVVGYVGLCPLGFVWNGFGVGCDCELPVVTMASACDLLPDVGGAWLVCCGFPNGYGAAGGCFDKDV